MRLLLLLLLLLLLFSMQANPYSTSRHIQQQIWSLNARHLLA
jgi:hypothetical protein